MFNLRMFPFIKDFIKDECPKENAIKKIVQIEEVKYAIPAPRANVNTGIQISSSEVKKPYQALDLNSVGNQFQSLVH